MTNVSALFSFGLTPAWLSVIPLLLGDFEYKIPFGEIASGVGQLVGPLFIGMIVNHFFQKKSEIAARVIVGITTLLLIVSAVLSIYKYSPISIISPAQIIFAFIFPLIGTTLGFILSTGLNLISRKRFKETRLEI